LKFLIKCALILGFAVNVGAQIKKTTSAEPVGSRTFVATAYSLRGKMANGEYVHAGAVAADPRVLPMGTKILIDGLGIFTVKDTGGAIKGLRLDIWMGRGAMKFGRKKVKVKILK
jgi:3D (Asp-Asp-Asp) domain-containing protein